MFTLMALICLQTMKDCIKQQNRIYITMINLNILVKNYIYFIVFLKQLNLAC